MRIKCYNLLKSFGKVKLKYLTFLESKFQINLNSKTPSHTLLLCLKQNEILFVNFLKLQNLYQLIRYEKWVFITILFIILVFN